MDADEYREYVRNRLLLLLTFGVAVGVGRWTGVLGPADSSGLPGRASLLQFVVLSIVVGWVVVALIGVVALIRRIRST